MHRGPVFDPLDQVRFNEQRQRFDWSLLLNGSVFRYETRFDLDSACQRLDELGYLVHRIDLQRCTEAADMHATLAEALSFPDYYGKNLDAFNDVMYDVGEFRYGSDPTSTGTVLALAGYDTVVDIDRHTADGLLTIFANHARLAALFSHPMLCLVESTTRDLGPIGGRAVGLGTVWDLPPSRSPIEEAMVVEFRFETTRMDAAATTAIIESTLAELIGEWARWQILDPVETESCGSADQVAGTARCDVVISVGVRGSGDLGEADEAVYRALQRAGLRVGASSVSNYPCGAERDRVLAKYSELQDPSDLS